MVVNLKCIIESFKTLGRFQNRAIIKIKARPEELERRINIEGKQKGQNLEPTPGITLIIQGMSRSPRLVTNSNILFGGKLLERILEQTWRKSEEDMFNTH